MNFLGKIPSFERIRMVRMVRMVRSLADRTFQLWSVPSWSGLARDALEEEPHFFPARLDFALFKFVSCVLRVNSDVNLRLYVVRDELSWNGKERLPRLGNPIREVRPLVVDRVLPVGESLPGALH